ncbi:MAG TPA: SUMF1/EgtB/PvdO family nonheme iron enzyme [Pirellulales bacterium]|nr:SUMF1/EgtB/PvdO family nonheme iron enzyme [Pirellulales bacterium]
MTELSVVANELLDLSPLRALSRLTSLWCEGRGGRVALRDISPLAGLPLTKLSLFQTSVADLSPLRGMPLEMLAVQVTPVSDLSPLAGMPLTDLNCSTTKVADLSPLRGMKLTILRCYAAQISDLSPLAGMPIKSLYAGSLPIRDLAPLAGMPLETLWIERTAVEDLSPLQQCKNLKSLKISNDRISTSQVAALQAALPQCKVTWEGPTAASNASTTTAGYALDFSPERKSYVEVPEWKYDGTTPLTVEAWVVPRGAATTQVVIEPVEAEGQTGFIPSLMISSSKKWRFTFASGKIVESNETINNRLAHLAGVFDGYQISLFLNGKQQRKPVSVDEPVEPAMLSLGLGARQRSARQLFFDGTIDEVRISNVARYTSDFTPAARFDPDDQTEVLYHFDEGSGTVARDASSHHRDGTISGATWVASNETRPLGSGSAAQYIPAGPSVDLLKHIDLAKAEVDFKGKPRWVWGDKVPGLLCQTSNSSTHLPIDYPAPEAYVIDARIIPRTEGRMRQVRFGLRTGEQRFFLDVDAHDNGKNQDPGPWSGLSMIDGAPAGRNETAVKATMLTPDKPLTIRIEVRPDAILVAFDGKSVVEYRGEMTRLSLPRVGTITDKSAQLGDLWLMSHESTLFESLTLTPLKPADGRGTAADSKAPPPAVAPFDATQAHAHQVAWSQYLGVPVKRKNSIGMAMMLIPPGEFLMGSTPEQIDYQRSRPSDDDEKRQDPATLSSEGPQHRVTLTKPFLIGATEVTLGQFGVFVEATKYVTEKERGTAIGPEKDDRAWNVYQGKRLENADLAVVEVTWNDAVAFCDWLSKKENATYRLPTEAEWEFACRAGTTTAYSFGNGEGVVNYAWVNDPANGPTRPVAEKLPNPFDLYDMHGHVAEFCQDRYGKNYYESSPLTDPIGPADGSTRVVRGGSWYAKPDFARSAARQNKAANYRLGYLGFRVVREIPPVAADLKAQGSDLKSDPNAASPLDALKREDIPPEELKAAGLGDPARAPAELVGVPVFYKPSAESWSGSARGMALSADGMTLVVTNDAARMLSVWDARSKKMSSTFPANRVATIYGMAFSPDGKTLATGDSMGIVKLWNVATRTPTATLSGHTDAVISVAFSPDGKRLASGARQIDGKDGSVRVWDVATGTERLRIAPELHDAHLAFSPDGGMLAVAGFGDTGSVRLRDPATGEELGRLDGASVGNSLRVAFSPDGRAVAAIKGSSVLVWDVPSRKRTRQLQVGTAYKSAVQDLAFHSDCRVIATVANDGCLRLWDTSTGNEIKSWQLGPPDGVIYRVQFDPTGRYLYTSNGNSSVYVLRLDAKAESGKPKAETSANAHRTAAEFVLSQGGTVAVRVGGTTIGKINSADKLPGGDFNVTAMDLSRVGQDDASAISDADVERLMALKTLEYLNINGRHELTIHVARILAESHLKVLLIGDVGVNDEWLEILSGLRTLDRLEIVPSAGITDRGLLHLEQLTKLKTLDLAGTKVTAAGMAKLQQALPNCKIEWDGAAKK